MKLVEMSPLTALMLRLRSAFAATAVHGCGGGDSKENKVSRHKNLKVRGSTTLWLLLVKARSSFKICIIRILRRTSSYV